MKLLWSTSKASLISLKGLKFWKGSRTSEDSKIWHFGYFENSKADVLTLKIHLFNFMIFSNVNKILPIIDPVFIPWYRKILSQFWSQKYFAESLKRTVTVVNQLLSPGASNQRSGNGGRQGAHVLLSAS